MTIDVNDKAAVEKRLWAEIADGRFGMLGATGSPRGDFQPMTAFCEPESKKIWFYTRNDTDTAVAAQGGVASTFIVMSREIQSVITGDLTTTLDVLHRDKFWNSAVAAWFAKGKNDPHLTMLCLSCTAAEVWLSDKGGLKFGWEIAKANLTGHEPDIGGHARLKLG
ncbi:MAG: pyridoxamine 5'-phosphate oxidase family protein [Caulobacteraceae bacterium]